MKKIQWWHKDLEKKNFLKNIISIIQKEDLTTGNTTKNYEKLISKTLNVKYSIAVSSGSMGTLLAFMALDVGSNDEVIIPNIGWISVINACKIIGAKPVLVDVENDRPIIDCKNIEKIINKKTKVIFPIYMNGRAANISELKKICKKRKIFLVEDSAQAVGIKKENKYLGTFGDIGIFSTSATKLLTTGLGGFLVTNNKKLAKKLYEMRRHGFSNIQNIRHWDKFGGNFQISSIQSAMGIEQLKTLRKKLKLNKRNYLHLSQKLKDLKNFITPVKINFKGGEVPVYNEFRVQNREKLVKFLNKNKIENRLVSPNFERVKYMKLKGKKKFPNSSDYEKNNLYLTSGPGLQLKDLDKIANKIRNFYLDSLSR
jgi:perosamine synthetase